MTRHCLIFSLIIILALVSAACVPKGMTTVANTAGDHSETPVYIEVRTHVDGQLHYGVINEDGEFVVPLSELGVMYAFLHEKVPPFDAIWINASGQIIWPTGWDDPCTDTGTNVIWPEGACLMEAGSGH